MEDDGAREMEMEMEIGVLRHTNTRLVLYGANYARDHFIDMLCRMDCSTLPSSPEEAKNLLMKLAQTELVHLRRYPLDCIISKESGRNLGQHPD